ncbi:hypothetical protein M422DRAFT_266229 [Sphaerobolus stellatus SS14]|uniref:Uncharacterized protein n=1 Tax=Sphaerobolus stellatus (strain SS14) TaxID=990650 RepID=A0A0C9US27_SPHS4|nr:hypothetical protein M422DRAFT_266229 [Sphaerobolus stellatus SS14]
MDFFTTIIQAVSSTPETEVHGAGEFDVQTRSLVEELRIIPFVFCSLRGHCHAYT